MKPKGTGFLKPDNGPGENVKYELELAVDRHIEKVLILDPDAETVERKYDGASATFTSEEGVEIRVFCRKTWLTLWKIHYA